VAVEIISEDVAVANDLDATNRNAWYERLGKRGAIFTAQTCVHSFRDDVLLLRHVFSDALSQRRSIELIVDWNGCRSVDRLLTERQAEHKLPQVQAIGDCLAPRNVETAMAEALLFASRL